MLETILTVSLLGAVTLSETETMQHILDAGFSKDIASTMVCIAKHESGLDPSVINTNRDKSKDYGLFQINDRWWGKQCEIGRLLDPAFNTQCAKIVYDTQGLTAWVAYKKHKAKCDNYKPVQSVCPKTRMVNETKRPWDERDDEVLQSARSTCKTKYAPNVCLVEFWRFDNYSYHATCGKER